MASTGTVDIEDGHKVICTFDVQNNFPKRKIEMALPSNVARS
jgi:hypothetical protein